jgi:hypothetical protein
MAKRNEDVNNFDLLREDGVHANLAVAGVTTVYTQTYVCPKDVTFGFEIKFASSGTVECDIEVEQGNISPATEGTADTNMVVPEGAGFLIENVGDQLVHVISYSPTVSNFLRFKISGTGANHASTVLERAVVNTIVNA